MLKDMQSIHAPGKTTKVSDVLAGDGKGNTGLAGLGEARSLSRTSEPRNSILEVFIV